MTCGMTCLIGGNEEYEDLTCAACCCLSYDAVLLDMVSTL